MFFTNKGVEIFNLPKILILKCFNLSDIKTWTTNQILQILTNNLLTNLIPDQSILRCYCEKSLFIDPEHGCKWYVIRN